MKFSLRRFSAAIAMAGLGMSAFAAGPLDKAVLHGETDKERAIDYKEGEESLCFVTSRNSTAVIVG